MKTLEFPIDTIKKLCKKHNASKMYIFGSTANYTMNENSDFDFLVEFKKINLSQYFKNYLDLKNELKKALGKKVDFVEHQTLKNPILIQSINQSKSLIYG